MTDIFTPDTEQLPPPWQPPAPSRATRTPPVRSRGHLCGELVGPDNRQILVESAGELAIAYYLLARRDVIDLWEQPPPVTYTDVDGSVHRTWFDFLVTHTDRTKTAIFVKPLALIERSGIRRIVALLADQMPRGYADRICILSKETIHPAVLYNAEQFHFARKDDDPEADEAMTAVASTILGSSRIGDLTAATGLKGRAFRAAVRLVGYGLMETVGQVRVMPETLVRWVGPPSQGRLQ